MNVIIYGYTENDELKELRAYNFPKNADVIDVLKIMKNDIKNLGIKVVTKVVNLDNCKVIYEA